MKKVIIDGIEYIPKLLLDSERELNNDTVEDKEDVVSLLTACVSATWGNPSLDKTQVLYDKFLYDRKLANPSQQLVNAFISDAVNRNMYDKKYSQSEADAIRKEAIENYLTHLSNIGKLNTNEPLSDSIPTLERQGNDDKFVDSLMKMPDLNAPQESKQDSKGWEIQCIVLDSKNYWVQKDGLYKSDLYGLHLPSSWFLSNGGTIHSVKRLSDGEVFSVGDKVCFRVDTNPNWVIDNFLLKDDGTLLARSNSCDHCEFIDDDLKKLPLTEQPKQVEKPMFLQALERLINGYSMENGSDTPDYILAQYLFNCLQAYNDAVTSRDTSKI